MSSNVDAPDQELGDVQQEERDLAVSDETKEQQQLDDGDEEDPAESSSSQLQESSSSAPLSRHCCLLKCLGYNKRTLCWISLAFLIIMILTTTLTTRNNYPSNQASDWILVGAVTPSSVTFRIRTDSTASQAESLVVYDSNNNIILEQSITYSKLVDSIIVDGLESNTRYTYQTLSSSENVISSGSFTTAPPSLEKANFTIASAGCAWTASSAPVFQAIQRQEPLLFLHLGDFHYEDINSPDAETRIQALDRVLASSPQANLFASTCFAVMWDDHDYLGNDSEGYQEGREAALESYTLGFPHYPLAAASEKNTSTSPKSPYHAFTIGSVRFIVSDLRSQATAESIYSVEQKEWLFGELANSTAYDFVVWVTTKPWIGPSKPGDDSWMGRPDDRAELSQQIVNVVTNKNLLAISADAHMVAFDDGRNTYYGNSTFAVESFPILQTGPLDRLGSAKGGPFSDGCFTTKYERNHQYSTLSFEFGNDESCIVITSYRVDGNSEDVILTRRLCGEIFGSTESVGSGTCEAATLSSGSIALVSIAAVFVVLCMLCACCVFAKCEATKMSLIVILAFVLSFIAGFGIPLAMGVPQYETFSILLVLMIQMLFTFIFILIWSLKKRSGKV